MERVKYKKSATWKNWTLQQHLTALLTIVAKLSILELVGILATPLEIVKHEQSATMENYSM